MGNSNKPAEDYIEHEKQLIARMQEDNFSLFDGDREEALDFMSSHLSRFTDYANVVIRSQYLQPLWRATKSTEDYIANTEAIDKERRMKHNCAIDSVNILNRMSKNLGLPPFADIDTSIREEVADFCGAYVNQVYNKGIGKDRLQGNMHEATKDRNTQYNVEQHSRKIKAPEYLQGMVGNDDPQYGG